MTITIIENYVINIFNPNPNTSLKGNSFVANYDAMLKRRFDVIKIHLLDKNKAEKRLVDIGLCYSLYGFFVYRHQCLVFHRMYAYFISDSMKWFYGRLKAVCQDEREPINA